MTRQSGYQRLSLNYSMLMAQLLVASNHEGASVYHPISTASKGAAVKVLLHADQGP